MDVDVDAQPIVSPNCLPESKTDEDEYAHHYASLGLSNLATEDQIRERYYQLIMKFHPDKHYNRLSKLNEAAREAENNILIKQFTAIQDAYEALVSKHQYAHHYASLGLSHLATEDQIRRRYYQLIMKFHPDKHFNRLSKLNEAAREAESDILTKQFTAVQDAYEALVSKHAS
ncbi:dnaJ protein subfamily C member [Trifolium repens]|jgi:curved DNA-binding protein CbpA|nr:dnaJ protein subfamily C member [Trifolium repens]